MGRIWNKRSKILFRAIKVAVKNIKNLPKIKCEIEGCTVTDSSALHYHHIIEQTELNTDNSPWNLAIICSVHHNLVHSGKIKIIGPYPSTNNNGRILVYEIDGKCNIPGITKPYYIPKIKSLKIRKS